MTVSVVFETHSTTLDNEQGRATGWLPGELSERGRDQARALGRRRVDDGVAVVLCSDLARTAETARIAFGAGPVRVLHDWRLRECDYGSRNGMPATELHAGRAEHLDVPYPGVARAGGRRWPGSAGSSTTCRGAGQRSGCW